jgi:hypothetical protein
MDGKESVNSWDQVMENLHYTAEGFRILFFAKLMAAALSRDL